MLPSPTQPPAQGITGFNQGTPVVGVPLPPILGPATEPPLGDGNDTEGV